MAEVVKKDIPKTIEIDVDGESYNRGWDDGYDRGAEHAASGQSSEPEKYFGHTAHYWQGLFISELPVILFLALILWWSRRCQKNAADVNNKILENQESSIAKADAVNSKIQERNERMVAELSKTNVLLQQLVEKLDKR